MNTADFVKNQRKENLLNNLKDLDFSAEELKIEKKISRRISQNDITTQIAIAKEVMSCVRSFYSNSIIAGGAPRNWFCAKDCNDIDIFVPSLHSSLKSGNIDCIEGELNCSIKLIEFKKKSEDDYIFSKNSLIHQVYEFFYRGEVFQLIFVNRSKWHLTVKDFVNETFDFDICKVFLSHGEIEVSDQAKLDFENKTLTTHISKLKKYQRLDTLPRRSEKLQSYFPSYKIKIAP